MKVGEWHRLLQCVHPFILLPVASGSTGALAGEHLQICLVIRNTCFSDGPLSKLQIPILLSLLNSGRWVVSTLKLFSFCEMNLHVSSPFCSIGTKRDTHQREKGLHNNQRGI